MYGLSYKPCDQLYLGFPMLVHLSLLLSILQYVVGCILRWQLYQIEKDKLNIWDILLEHKKKPLQPQQSTSEIMVFYDASHKDCIDSCSTPFCLTRSGAAVSIGGVNLYRRPCVSIHREDIHLMLTPQTHTKQKKYKIIAPPL